MKKTLIIMAVVAFQLATGTLRGGDLRVIYPGANFIINRDEILYVEAKYPPAPAPAPPPNGVNAKKWDLEHPPEVTNKPLLADIHFKNGMILHVTMTSMEDLAIQLK